MDDEDVKAFLDDVLDEPIEPVACPKCGREPRVSFWHAYDRGSRPFTAQMGCERWSWWQLRFVQHVVGPEVYAACDEGPDRLTRMAVRAWNRAVNRLVRPTSYPRTKRPRGQETRNAHRADDQD